jgi:hypothetical protein
LFNSRFLDINYNIKIAFVFSKDMVAWGCGAMTKTGPNDTSCVVWAHFRHYFLFFYVKFIPIHIPAYPLVGYGFMWGTVSPTHTPTPRKPAVLPRGFRYPRQSLLSKPQFNRLSLRRRVFCCSETDSSRKWERSLAFVQGMWCLTSVVATYLMFS